MIIDVYRYTMLEVKLISGGGDNLWILACTPNKA